jgi:hypothetical protein
MRTRLGAVPLPVLAILLALSCGGSPWSVSGAPKSPPDEQFRTGVEVGEDVYVWHCYEGKRVVVTQTSSACFGARSPELASGACGAPLTSEARYNDAQRKAGVPDSMRWPGSGPGP